VEVALKHSIEEEILQLVSSLAQRMGMPVEQALNQQQPHTTKSRPPPTVQDTVSRLRISYPFLRAAKVDYLLR
jgi:outer membrane protein TolC